MIIRAFKRLSELRKSQIKSLESACTAADSFVCPVFCDPSLNFTRSVPAFFFATVGNRAVGVLSLFLPGDGSAEISALVHPAYRRKGVFTALLTEAGKTIKQLRCAKILIVSYPGCPACDEVLKNLRAKYHSSEFKMYLPKAAGVNCPKTSALCGSGTPLLRPITHADFPVVSPLLADFFDTDEESAGIWVETILAQHKEAFFKYMLGETCIGTAGFIDEGGCCSIFGIGIAREYRGKGYGKQLMCDLLALMPGESSVVLQVSDKNAAALSLYQKLGFSITATTRYHKLKL